MPHRIAFHEKLFFGISSLISSSFSLLGAIVSTGEARWLCVTFTACIVTSTMLALIFKQPNERIGKVVGRCGIALLCGVLGTKYVVGYYAITSAHDDMIVLAGVSSLTCIAGFMIGVPLLKVLENRSSKIAAGLFQRWTGLPAEKDTPEP